MSNCDNNCEAVADLHESSVNLIQYSKQFNNWLNGGQNESVNIGGVSTPTLRNLAMAIKQLVGVYPDEQTITIDANKKIKVKLKNKGGIKFDSNGLYLALAGGVKINANGELEVDLSNMPTDKFEAMIDDFRKSLRLPKWLTSNLNLFVDNTNANATDDLEQNPGTSSKPFASLQACLNFVTDNYNLSTYNAHIYVKSGTTYNGALILPEYQTNTGAIYIHSWTGTGTNEDLSNKYTIKRIAAAAGGVTGACGLVCLGGNWDVRNIQVITEVSEFSNTYFIMRGILCNGGTLNLRGFHVKHVLPASINNLSALTRSIDLRPVLLNSASGKIGISPGSSDSIIEVVEQAPITKDYAVRAISSYYSELSFSGSNTAGLDHGYIDLKIPNMAVCASASYKGAITFSSINGSIVDIMRLRMATGYTATGKRYECLSGGSINTSGRGPEFLPGAEAGTADATTYSWYK